MIAAARRWFIASGTPPFLGAYANDVLTIMRWRREITGPACTFVVRAVAQTLADAGACRAVAAPCAKVGAVLGRRLGVLDARLDQAVGQVPHGMLRGGKRGAINRRKKRRCAIQKAAHLLPTLTSDQTLGRGSCNDPPALHQCLTNAPVMSQAAASPPTRRSPAPRPPAAAVRSRGSGTPSPRRRCAGA